MEDATLTRIFEKNYNHIKRNGKIYLFILLATIPGLCFSSVKLHAIKLGASKTLRCKMTNLENSSWTIEEIRHISEPTGAHKECFIYNYDYDKLVHMTLKDAKKLVDKDYANRTRIICTRFVAAENNSLPPAYPTEFANYCESLKYDFVYDLFDFVPHILSCLVLVPLADIYGRKRILFLGCHLVFVSIFVKILMLDFTRDAFGESLFSCAYPVLKYTTEAIIIEVIGNELRPVAFVVTFLGLYMPQSLSFALPIINWRLTTLLNFTPVLLLPLSAWYLPEPSLWFISRRQTKAAFLASETLNNTPEHNDYLFDLRDKIMKLIDPKKFIIELIEGINWKEFLLINVISIGLGFLSFNSYSKHKLMYSGLENGWIKFLIMCSELFAIACSIPSAYLMNGSKFLFPILFLANGTLFTALCFQKSGNLVAIAILTFFIEILSVTTKILYEFYLQNIFPTSHRCICTGMCGAITTFGLIIITGIRQLNLLASQIITTVACFVCCITSAFVIKNLRQVNPVRLNFNTN